MTNEKSCGAVVFTRAEGKLLYVLAQALGGHYGFPKGHVEPGETEEETALREIREEVGLSPTLLKGFREVVEYDIPDVDVHKQVVFFLAEFQDQKVVCRKEELSSAPVLPFEQAMELLTHEDSKRVLTHAHAFLSGRKYYEAYDERYKTAHSKGVSWMSSQCTPIVLDTIKKYRLDPASKMLEIGCGEGRDSGPVLAAGYDLLATDISPEAISYCRTAMPEYREHFACLDCIGGIHEAKYDFIYSVAVIHMFVPDEDRAAFYRFIRGHLTEGGMALICTMGDGSTEMHSDVTKAFELQEREHEIGKMMVASTSCRMVSFETFEGELKNSGLQIVEKGITASMPSFNSLMYCVVKRAE